MILPDVAPRPTSNKSSAHPGRFRRFQIVVYSVPYVDDLVWRAWRCVGQCSEERQIWFTHAPVIGSCDHVGWQVQFPKDISSSGSLVPGHADPQAHFAELGHRGPNVWVQVTLAERLRLTSLCSPHTFFFKSETGPEVLKCLSVVPPQRDYSTEYCGERMPGYS